MFLFFLLFYYFCIKLIVVFYSVVICFIVCLFYFIFFGLLDDFFWEEGIFGIWFIVEVNIGIVCGCVMRFKKFVMVYLFRMGWNSL